ncbi:MAG: flagellar protein export ATPase FliI [Alphaproteobacteria bacterium]|nr:flagellar protein export ATPase FliI [Alphaproteobacteria bacterium]
MNALAQLNELKAQISRIEPVRFYGRITAVMGLLIECGGLQGHISVGSRCAIEARGSPDIAAEVVGFRPGRALLMPFGAVEGIGLGCRVFVLDADPVVFPSHAWLGRIVNALGEPIDGGPPLPRGPHAYALRSAPPPASNRCRVTGKLDLGVRAINAFLTCCRGQRMGIFAGSGVGKSVLLAMLAHYTASQVNVIGLIGERGREVQEFIEDEFSTDGLARSVVVVATSDEPALMRRQAAYLTMTLAESFRDEGLDVLYLMDSVTRFAMAQREIGLSAGEPPTSKGYTPTVFSELPKLLERAGPGTGKGTVTGLFTVLVEGDDHTEPVADAVRSILDGHIWLDRAIAERGRYPAVNVLRSISRTMPGCNSDDENRLVMCARQLMATYDDMTELIRLGAYRAGSDPAVDEAIAYRDALEAFLAQDRAERCDLAKGYATLAQAVAPRGARTDLDGGHRGGRTSRQTSGRALPRAQDPGIGAGGRTRRGARRRGAARTGAAR